MATYMEVYTELTTTYRCKVCGGLGTVDDAESGDISFNTYDCHACDGTGWAKGMRYILKWQPLALLRG